VHWRRAAKWDSDLTVRLGELVKLARERTRRKHGGKSFVPLLEAVNKITPATRRQAG
jgi:hypothetical protein